MTIFSYQVTLEIRQAYNTVPQVQGHGLEAKEAFERRVKGLGEYRGTICTVVSMKEVKPEPVPTPPKPVVAPMPKT